MSSSSYHRPPEDPRVAQTRSLVLGAARQLLIEEGQEAVIPTRLAEITGISRSTIYRHWSDPHDIIFEAAAMDVERPPFDPTGDPATDLRTYLVALRRGLETNQGRLLATQVDRAETDGKIDARIREAYEARCELMARVAQHPGEGFAVRQALLVGPLFFMRYFARESISDELIDLVVEEYLASLPSD